MIKVLLLEDETMIQMLLEDYVSDLGYETIPTSNLDEALAASDSHEFDIALLDINLGDGTNSFPMAERMVERGKPFAFMSGYSSQSIEGFETIPKLSKPINFALLTKTLQELAERAVSPKA
jgi:DNA-binding response OmpR family regulator